MNEDIKQKITQRLIERIGRYDCPICHKGPFTILDHYHLSWLTDDPNTYTIGDGAPCLVSAVLICNHCGYTALHNLPALGITLDTSPATSVANKYLAR